MPTTDELRAEQWTILAAIGGLIAIVSAALPWFSVADILPPRSGLQGVGDGWYTLGIGLLIVILAVRSIATHRPWRRLSMAAVVGGFFLVAIPALGFQNFRLTAMLVEPSLGDLVTPGIGLYGTVFGGILMILGGWLSSRAHRRLRRTEPATQEPAA